MPSSALLICLLLAVLLVSLDALPFFGFGKESVRIFPFIPRVSSKSTHDYFLIRSVSQVPLLSLLFPELRGTIIRFLRSSDPGCATRPWIRLLPNERMMTIPPLFSLLHPSVVVFPYAHKVGNKVIPVSLPFPFPVATVYPCDR